MDIFLLTYNEINFVLGRQSAILVLLYLCDTAYVVLFYYIITLLSLYETKLYVANQDK